MHYDIKNTKYHESVFIYKILYIQLLEEKIFIKISQNQKFIKK